MTDREPDDLYDALRGRLADYGQEPPAPLWAGIRAQLPPVAAPQLRPRRRKSVVALLLLLLAIVGVGTWQWQHLRRRGELAQQRARKQASAARRVPQTVPTASDEMAPETGLAAGPAASESAAGLGHTPASASMATQASAVTVVSAAESRASAIGRRPTGVAPRTSAGFREPASPALALASSGARHLEYAGRPALQARAAARGSEDETPAAARQVEQRPSSIAAMAATRAQAQATAARSQNQAIRGTTPATSGERIAEELVATPETNAAGSPTGETAALAAIGPVAGRCAALQLLAPGSLRLQLPADTLPRLTTKVVRRWAVQVLGGPALTYRTLGSPTSQGYYPVPARLPNTILQDLQPAADHEQAETARTGYDLAVEVRRVLNGRWSLTTGLGYQEFALQRTYDELTSVKTSVTTPPPVITTAPSSTPPAPVTTYTYIYSPVSYRDTYRFLNVPVRVGYDLGLPGRRLRVGLLAGAEAATYLGGRSAGRDGTRHDWTRVADSPNRALNLSVSGGLDLRYRLASRLELLAQPGATYFVNSLSKPTSGLAPRQLVEAGVRFGLSFDLR
jgi:hypothetical protein